MKAFLYMCKNYYFNFGGIFLTEFFGHSLRSQSCVTTTAVEDCPVFATMVLVNGGGF